MSFPSALSREAHVLLGNIRDLSYCMENNKTQLKSFRDGDADIMKSILKSMIKSHKRMIGEMVKSGEWIGDPKSIKYKI